MNNDWIKVRKALPTSPRFVRMMSALNADKFRTLGAVLSAWMIFDEHSTDGLLPGYTPALLDSLVGYKGLAKAMQDAGWLMVEEDGLRALEFDKHNGSTAKRRAMEAERKSASRWDKRPHPMRTECADSAVQSKSKSESKKEEEEGGTPSTPPRKPPSDLNRTLESIEAEFGQAQTSRTYKAMREWCERKGETPSLRRLVTWLRRDLKAAAAFAAVQPAKLPPDPLGLRESKFNPHDCL